MTTGWRDGCSVHERYMIGAGTKRRLDALIAREGASWGRDETMRKLGLAAVAAASVAAAGCATYPNQYGYDPYYNNGYYNNGYYNNGYYGSRQPGRPRCHRRCGRRGRRRGCRCGHSGRERGRGRDRRRNSRRRSRCDRQRPSILSRYPRLLLLRRPIRSAALQLRHSLLVQSLSDRFLSCTRRGGSHLPPRRVCRGVLPQIEK